MSEADQNVYSEIKGEGLPVVLVHGVLSSIHCWDYNVPALNAAGYKTYVPELLGHGESAMPTNPKDYIASKVYQHFAVWLDSQAIAEPFWLVSHSLGSYMALKYANTNPSKIKGIVLIAPLINPAQVDPGIKMALRDPEKLAKLFAKFPLWISKVTAWFFNNTWGLPAEAQHNLALDQQRAHPYTLCYTIPSLDPLDEQITNFDRPTLIIWGDRDRSLQHTYFETLVEQIPQAKAYRMKGIGHVPQLARASEVNAQILEFFAINSNKK